MYMYICMYINDIGAIGHSIQKYIYVYVYINKKFVYYDLWDGLADCRPPSTRNRSLLIYCNRSLLTLWQAAGPLVHVIGLFWFTAIGLFWHSGRSGRLQEAFNKVAADFYSAYSAKVPEPLRAILFILFYFVLVSSYLGAWAASRELSGHIYIYVSMYVCVCVCVCVCVYIYTSIYIYICMSIYICKYRDIYIYIYIYIYAVCIFMYYIISTYTYTHIYIYIYICIL